MIPLVTSEQMLVYYLTLTTNLRGTSLAKVHSYKGAASTSEKYVMSMMGRLKQRILGTVNWVCEETVPTSPSQKSRDK